MAPTMRDLGIDRLSIDERIVLMNEIWDSLDAEPQTSPLTDELREELSRRIKDIDDHPENFVPWEQVREELMARRKK